MPRIERYTKGIIRQRAVADTVDPSAIKYAGQGFHAAANVLAEGAAIADKWMAAKETVAVNEAIISNKKAKMDFLDKARQENMMNPEDFAKRIEPELQAIDQQMMESLPSSRAKDAFSTRMLDINFQAYQDNFKWSQNRQVEIFAESVDRSAQKLGNLALQRGMMGGSIDDLMKDAQATVVAGSTFVAPEKLAGMSEATQKNIERNYAMGLMQSNPAKAKSWLSDFDNASHITGGDRINLIQTADNLIKAEKNRALEQELLSVADIQKNRAVMRERVYTSNEPVEQMILDIRKQDSEGAYGKGSFGTDMVQILNAKKKMETKAKPTETQKNDWFTEVSDLRDALAVGDEELSKESLAKYDELETKVMSGVGTYMTAKQAQAFLKAPRAFIDDNISENKVVKSWGKWKTGIQDPVGQVLKDVKKEYASTPRLQREVLGKFSDLLGKVNEDGSINPEGEYESSGNSSVDKAVINRTLKMAKQMVNQEVNSVAADNGANGVVKPVPKVGTVVGGYRFKGGNPADPSNWEKE